MDIKPEPHTEQKKAYLTYEPTQIARARLLFEKSVSTSEIFFDGKKLYSIVSLNHNTKKALEQDGFVIHSSIKITYIGKSFFVTSVGSKIPVVIRKIQKNGVLNQIRVRISAPTHEELMDRTYAIRDTLAAYGLKHKLCVWDRTGTI